MAKDDKPTTTPDQDAERARIEQGTLTADEREYVPVPDDEKPHPSTVMHYEVLPGQGK